MERVTHHGRTTAYRRTAGEGPAVCYVHGSGADHTLWAAQYAPDATDRPAVALDLSGHGESDDVDAAPGFETLSAYADDVLAVARETDAEVLVGNSLGGAVCLHLLLERQIEPTALVLAGSGAKLAVLDDLLRWLDGAFEQAVEFLHGEDRLFHDPDPELRDRSRELMLGTGQAVTRRDFRSCHTFDVRDRLGEIAVPTLAVVGEYDRLTPPKYHEYLAENVRRGEVATIADAAHLAMVERPEEFDAAVELFLREVEAA